MFDIVIKGGTLVDGTGAEARRADVGVKDGVVTEVAPSIEADAAETIDAADQLVTPGFVDIHTHYDGQATWDETLDPSAGHGVTTLVMGNCGVGFAPVHPGQEDWLIQLMEGVEDIPGTALAEGMTWGWETFPEYLDTLDARRFAVDIGTQIPHGAVRGYVMGERGARNEPATPEDIAAMADIVQEAVEAGALGFSTSRTIAHRAIDGEPVPGTYAAEEELFGIGRAMARGGASIFELAPAGVDGLDLSPAAAEMSWMRRLSAEIERPVTFIVLQVDLAPDLWKMQMEESMTALDEGAEIYPQIANRPFGMLIGFQTTTPSPGDRRTWPSPACPSTSACASCASRRSAPPSSPRRTLQATAACGTASRRSCAPSPRSCSSWATRPSTSRRPTSRRRRWPRPPASPPTRWSTTSSARTRGERCSCCRCSTTPTATTTSSASR